MDRNQALWLPIVLVAALGIPEAAAQATLFSNEGLMAGDLFGACALRIADVDNDTVPDLLVGAPNASPAGASNAGELAVISGITGARVLTIPGTIPLERFGAALAAIGDVTFDGIPEIAVGVPGAGGGLQVGAVRILNGASFAALGTIPGPSTNARFGESLASLDDVNGNGSLDLAVAAPGFTALSGANAGAVFVLDGVTGATLRTFTGMAAFDALGSDLASIADLNGDGLRDLLIGTPGFDSGAGSGSGRSRAVNPTNGATLWTFDGPVAGESVGFVIDDTLDLDQDGVADVVVGAPGAAPSGLPLAGRAYVLSGAAGTILTVVDGLLAGDRLGSVVAGLGDLDADGRGDIAVASPEAQINGNPSAGIALVLRGGAFTPLYVFEGSSANEGLGGFVADIGDANGDGRSDFVIGNPLNDGLAGINSGSLVVKAAQVGAFAVDSTGKYGSAYALTLQAMPNQPAFLFIDVAPGAFASPFGMICVGLTPFLSVVPIGFVPSTGVWSTSGVIPPGGTLVQSFHLQAIVQEPWSAVGWRASACPTLTVGP
jgi:hypothetical protein